MKVINRFLNYWSIVLQRAFSLATREEDIKSKIWGLAKNVLIYLGITSLIFLFGKNYIPNSWITWADASFADTAKVILVSIATLFANIFLRVLYIPAEMYFEEHRLHSWDEVNISIDRDPIFGVGLRIKSDKDIKELGRELHSIWKGQTRLYQDKTPIDLLTLKEDKKMLTRVKKGVFKNSRMIPIANYDSGRAWFVTSEYRDECNLEIKKGNYYIEIVLTGEINGRKLENYGFAGDLTFDGKAIHITQKYKHRKSS